MNDNEKKQVAAALHQLANTLEQRGADIDAASDPIALGKALVSKRLDHPAMKALSAELTKIEQFLEKADKENRGMARIGGANAHLPSYLTKELVPMVEGLSKTAKTVAKQLKDRLKQTSLGASTVSSKRKPYKANNGVTYDDPVYAHIYSAADKIFDASFELQELLKGLHSGEYRAGSRGTVQDLKKAVSQLNRVGQKVYERKHSFE